MFTKAFRHLSAWAPPCQSCEKPSWSYLCDACLNRFRRRSVRKLGDFVIAYEFAYEDWAHRLLWKFKEEAHTGILNEFLDQLPLPFGGSFDCLVAVPCDPVRNRRRFFDPSHELARLLSKHWRIVHHRNLIRRRPMPFAQKDLGKDLRKRLLPQALRFEGSDVLLGPRVLLIDDLMTTGESLRASAELLRPHCEEVCLWTLFLNE